MMQAQLNSKIQPHLHHQKDTGTERARAVVQWSMYITILFVTVMVIWQLITIDLWETISNVMIAIQKLTHLIKYSRSR